MEWPRTVHRKVTQVTVFYICINVVKTRNNSNEDKFRLERAF